MEDRKKTDFGFQDIWEDEKPAVIKSLFSRVSSRYDLMNDCMSLGLHRLWKKMFVELVPVRPHMKLLDVAGGTGDIALRFLKKNGMLNPHVTVLDPTPAMMEEGKAKSYDQNNFQRIEWLCGMAEELPFPDNTFDAYTISFGLRNVTDREKALREALRVLKPGAPFFCMEFSKIQGPLAPLYHLYSRKGIPLLGRFVAADKDAYQYLSESIERFWAPEIFLEKLKQVGFTHCRFHRLSQGLVAIHQGWKP